MSRIIVVTLLLIILVHSFCDSTAVRFRLNKKVVRKCRCKFSVFPSGMIKCHSPLIPKIHDEQMNLIKCFCSKIIQNKFPELQAPCKSWHPGAPISLV